MRRFVMNDADGRLSEKLIDDEGSGQVSQHNHNPAAADCQCGFCTHKLTKHIKDDWDYLIIDEHGYKRDVRAKLQAKHKKPKHKALNIKVEVMEDDD